MKSLREIPWSRIVAESVAIVASILLAFAIDAWWEHRSEQDQEAVLIAGLYTDFRASQAHLEQWLAGNRRVLRASTLLLEKLEATALDESTEVEFEWILAAIGTPTYSPTDATLQAANSSGRVELLRDMALRKALAAWRQQLDDTSEDELLIRSLVVQKIVPILAEQLRLGRPFDFNTITGWFTGQAELEPGRQFVLRVTTKLEAAIAERVFYENFVVGGLADIHETQAEILRILEKNIGGQ